MSDKNDDEGVSKVIKKGGAIAGIAALTLGCPAAGFVAVAATAGDDDEPTPDTDA